MGIVAADLNFARTISTQIRQMGKRAAKHGVEFMRDAADEIVEIAKDYAPYDEGKLEEAIERRPEENRDATMGGRRMIGIWVNPEMPGSGGEPVGKYAQRVHEDMQPYGDINRGKGTIAKGPQAGAKFLERAIEDVKPRLTDRIVGLLRRQKLI